MKKQLFILILFLGISYVSVAQNNPTAEKVEKKQDLNNATNDLPEDKKVSGFKNIKEHSEVSFEGVTMKFNSVETAKSWFYDDYGTGEMFKGAERGDIYLVANASISSDSKKPLLLPIGIYHMSKGRLEFVETMIYEFAKWESYDSYLGINADYGNDFAHTETIPFSCGWSMAQDIVDNDPIFIVVKKINCVKRKNMAYDHPPIMYWEVACNMKRTLTLDDFNNDYSLIKIFNKNKL